MNHFSFLAYSPQVKHMTWGGGGGICVMLDLFLALLQRVTKICYLLLAQRLHMLTIYCIQQL